MQERPTGKNLPVYASLSTMRQEPSQSEMNNGVIPLDTLPAAWWNWMWNAITQAQNDSMYNDDVLFTEINNVLTEAGITPGTSSQHDQLRQAINVIKGAIATTAEAGSVLSTDGGTTGTVKVGTDGRMTVNNFGDIASFHGASKDNLMSALNETYDIAYGSNDSVGELSTLTTTAKDTLVDAINELDAGKAPTMHASSETMHGIGNADNYGHVKLTDTPGSADAASGTAATPKLVQDVVSGGLGAVNAVSYTFVVDSNDKLAAWANNDRSKGQDYTNVLIRKGRWTSTKGVNLTTSGTKVVVGEAGSRLVFDNVEKGLYYDTAPTRPDYYMHGVTVDAFGEGYGTVTGTGTGFHSCTNLSNCTGTGAGEGHGAGTGYGYGFHSCTNLSNCTGTGTGEGYTTGTGYGYGFHSCSNLSNCTGIGTGEGYGAGHGAGEGYGFHSCSNLSSCTGTGTGTGEGTGIGAGKGYGFHSCSNLSSCTGTGTATVTDAGTGYGYGYGFHSCSDLSSCTGEGTATATDEGAGTGFHRCSNLSSCTGTGTATITGYGAGEGCGFHSCSNLSNCTGTGEGNSAGAGTGTGFHSCSNLSNCTGTGAGEGTGYGFGFYSCNVAIGCKAGKQCSTVVFQDCYASSSETSAHACADTPNGGFNNTTNPAA